MVRTKQVRKKSSFVRRQTQSTVNKKTSSQASSDDAVYNVVSKDYESRSDFINELNTFYEGELEKLKQSYEYTCSFIRKIIDEKLQSCPESVGSANINNVIEGDFQDQNKNPNILSPPTVRKPRSRKSIELFDFKRPKTPQLPSRSSTRKRSASASVVSSSSVEKFKTPMMSSRMLAMGQTITPKIYSNTPMSVMRRPQLGEMAVSLTGSPLLVGSVTCEEVPTVNVPLQDGRVFSIMPQEGAPPPDLPDFDDQTKEYLRTLQAHLALLAPKTP